MNARNGSAAWEIARTSPEAKANWLKRLGFRSVESDPPPAGIDLFVSGECVVPGTGFPTAVFEPNSSFVWNSCEHRGTHSITHWRIKHTVPVVNGSWR